MKIRARNIKQPSRLIGEQDTIVSFYTNYDDIPKIYKQYFEYYKLIKENDNGK